MLVDIAPSHRSPLGALVCTATLLVELPTMDTPPPRSVLPEGHTATAVGEVVQKKSAAVGSLSAMGVETVVVLPKANAPTENGARVRSTTARLASLSLVTALFRIALAFTAPRASAREVTAPFAMSPLSTRFLPGKAPAVLVRATNSVIMLRASEGEGRFDADRFTVSPFGLRHRTLPNLTRASLA